MPLLQSLRRAPVITESRLVATGPATPFQLVSAILTPTIAGPFALDTGHGPMLTCAQKFQSDQALSLPKTSGVRALSIHRPMCLVRH